MNRKVTVGAFRVPTSAGNDMDVTDFVVPEGAEGPALVVIPVDGVPTLFAVFIQAEGTDERPDFKGLLHGIQQTLPLED